MGAGGAADARVGCCESGLCRPLPHPPFGAPCRGRPVAAATFAQNHGGHRPPYITVGRLKQSGADSSSRVGQPTILGEAVGYAAMRLHPPYIACRSAFRPTRASIVALKGDLL